MKKFRNTAFMTAIVALRVPLLAALMFLALPAAAQTDGERVLFELANRERKAQGIAALRWDDSLANAARVHAQIMAQHRELSHQFPDEADLATRLGTTGARFSAVAENVAFGPSPEEIHTGWMHSPPHKKNLMDPALNSLGIAIVEKDGVLYAVQDFSRSVVSLSLEDQEGRVGAELKADGLRILAGDDARRDCAAGPGHETSNRPMYVLQYSSNDLDMLPPTLAQEIKTGRYHAAAVGACAGGHAGGFSNYKIAVLLYE